MASSQVVLYDLPSKQGIAWSLNPWKTRMILNYKKIPYTTEWVEYPDLAPKFKALSIPPNPKDAPGYFADYSSPAIKYADRTYQMDSWPIAHSLEQQYPTPSLYLDQPIVVKIRDYLPQIIDPIRPLVIPRVALLLNERSAEYFYETREKTFGKRLEQVEKDADVDECWEKVKGPLLEVGNLLRQHEGPFFLGETVSYADFMLVSMLHFVKLANEDVYEKLMALDYALPRIYHASEQWLEKEN